MRHKLDDLYRNAAEEFARRAVSALGDQVDSIVLFGSAARREAKKDSDIDILVVGRPTLAVKSRLSDIASDFMYDDSFVFFISLVHLSRRRFLQMVRFGFPFVHNVLQEGVILYDRGIFSRAREKATPVGRRSLERRQISVPGRAV